VNQTHHTPSRSESGRIEPDRSDARSRLYGCQAIVIRRRDFGEADRLLTLVTDRHGKLHVIAKGVRRTQSRMAGHLEPFARSSLLIARGRNLDIVTQAQVIDPFLTLRDSEAAIAHAGYWADVVDALTVERQENVAAFATLRGALAAADRGEDLFLTTRVLETELLIATGFAPEVLSCVACGAGLQPVVNGFSFESGGVLCPACRSGEPDATPVSANALKVLRILFRGESSRLRSLPLSQPLQREIELVLVNYLRHVIERDLDGYRVLRRLYPLHES
jgi:DNA repair protein RecO (recombination protein O)